MPYSDRDILTLYENLELDIIKKMKTRLTAMQLANVKKTDIDRWVASQMSQLQKFKRDTATLIKRYNKTIQKETQKNLLQQYQESRAKELKRVIRNYGKSERFKDAIASVSVNDITGLNDRRMVALLSAVKSDTEKALTSIFRKTEDQYRQTIFKSAAEFNAGTVTLPQAVDNAQRDFLAQGINSITYKNGHEVNIRSYAEMALRTNGNRAALQGAATLRNQIGLYYVEVSSHGTICPACAAWSGQIVIDDVYQDGKDDGKYPLLSDAIASGLLHPNCRCTLLAVDPEIDGERPSISYTTKDEEKYNNQQHQRKLERDVRAYKRLAAGSTDPDTIKAYNLKVRNKQAELRDFIDKHNDYLIRQYDREKI